MGSVKARERIEAFLAKRNVKSFPPHPNPLPPGEREINEDGPLAAWF
jgi:hypothetical protein